MATAEIITVARASAALAAAGAFDTSPTEMAVNQGSEVTLYFDYTRGAAGGAFSYKIETSLDKVNWYQESGIQEIAIVAGADLVALSQRALISYTSTSASKESFASDTFTVAERFFRVNVAETGIVLTPGTLKIVCFVRENN